MPAFLSTVVGVPLLPYSWRGTPSTLTFHRGGRCALLLTLPLN